MTVWEKVAAGTSLSKDGVSEWLTKYKIKACELEYNVKYTGNKLQCDSDCSRCLTRYLSIEIDDNCFEQLSLF